MKKIKGFTLIELILVMAIMTILMVAIMNMFRPIRSVYVDATLYESQRTAQNGMVQYITESTRYATNLALDNSSINMTDAIKAFAQKLEWIDDQERKIEVLYVDNQTDANFDGRNFRGRLYRYTALVTAHVVSPTVTTFDIEHHDGTAIKDARLALGAAYYGPYTYSISLKYDDTSVTDFIPASPTIKISVSSLITSNLNTQSNTDTDDIASSSKFVLTEGEVNMMNVSSKVKDSGIYNIKEYAGNNSTTMGDITYILYTTDKK